MADKDCLNCGRPAKDKPAIFRNEPYCCDDCRRALGIKIGGE